MLQRERPWTRVWCLALLLTFLPIARGQSPYHLKAAVLGNLAKFVEWPTNSFSNADQPVRLAILGTDPFGPDLETILKPIKAKGRSFVVLRSPSPPELAAAHVIFCPEDQTDKIPQIVRDIANRPVLLVGEHPRFLELGGMVNFHMEERRVRFSINLKAADEAGLQVHAQVLKLATSVHRKARSE